MRIDRRDWMDVSPATATEWLTMNRMNRPVHPSQVDRLSADMAAGRWVVTGEPIIFGVSGHLLDGQHRLKAVIRSGKTIRFRVVWDAPDDSFKGMGRGVIRSPGDLMAMHGYKNHKLVATALAWVRFYESGGKYAGSTLYGDELLEVAASWPEVIESAELTTRYRKSQAGLLTGVTTGAVTLFLRIDRDDAIRFVRDLGTGVDLAGGDPVLLLRNRVLQSLSSKAKLDKGYLFGLCLKAWEQRRAGRTLKFLSMRQVGDQAESFPVLAGLGVPSAR